MASNKTSSPKIFLVYCIFESRKKIISTIPVGVDGLPVQIMEHSGLGAVVSHVADNQKPEIAQIIAYEKVVETFFQQQAVLPVRYGCLLETESQGIEFLEKHQKEYYTLLREVEGCVEMGIRVILASPKKEIEERDPSQNVYLPPGKAYLVQQKHHYREENRWTQVEEALTPKFLKIFARLFCQYKTEYSLSSRSVFPTSLLSYYFLIKRECEEAFRKAFQTLKQQEVTQMLLSGPWPPYNFVQVEKDDLSTALKL